MLCVDEKPQVQALERTQPVLPLTPAQRQDLLDHYHRPAAPAVGHRAHNLLLLDAGHPWATIGAKDWPTSRAPVPRAR